MATPTDDLVDERGDGYYTNNDSDWPEEVSGKTVTVEDLKAMFAAINGLPESDTDG